MKKQISTEQEIIRNALDMFHNRTGLHVRRSSAEIPDTTETGTDIVLKITVDNEAHLFHGEVKINISPAGMGTIMRRFGPAPATKLLLTRYVTPNMAEELRAKGIQFIDTAGNAYLNASPFFVLITGNRPDTVIRAEKTKRAFQPSGLRVIFALLLRPALVSAPYREIADWAGVALGTVTWVIRDLKELGFLVTMGKRGRRLTRIENLMERWVTTYPEQLRPKLVLGKFTRVPSNRQTETKELELVGACLGGEHAAARITGLLRPQTTTIYAREDINALVLRNRLRKDAEGNIEILKTFWSGKIQEEYGDQAPPLVVYADLLATADARNIEIAQLIYEQETARLLNII